ncbi:SPOSA6832_04295, partial [Sporobolomyces salmonicolor]
VRLAHLASLDLRSSYPPALYAHVLAYLDANPPSSTATRPRTVLDLGAGPGLSTFPLAPHFDRAIGVDPSLGMVTAARDLLTERISAGEVDEGRIRFEQGTADSLLRVVEDESVDLAVAGPSLRRRSTLQSGQVLKHSLHSTGQAAHWFDPAATYAELARVLKPGGAFAFWGYGECFFPSRPELSELIPPYSGGTLGAFPPLFRSLLLCPRSDHPTLRTGKYWEQPGRSIVEGLLVRFPLPLPSVFPSASSPAQRFDPATFHRSFFLRSASSPAPSLLPAESSASSPVETSTHPLLLVKHWSLSDLTAYFRTWSSRHAYQEEHGKDPVEGIVSALRERGLREGEVVEVGWEVAVVMGRKRK